MNQKRTISGRHTVLLYAGIMSVLLICVLFFYYFKYDRVRTLRASLGRIAGEPLSFSADSGFYEEGFVLRLRADEGIPGDDDIEIHYTFNGDEPSADDPLYTDGIDLEEVIRQLQAEEVAKAEEIAAMRKEAAEEAAAALEEAAAAGTDGKGAAPAQTKDPKEIAAALEEETPEEKSLENQRLQWEREFYTAASDNGVYAEKAPDGIYVIPIRARLIQGEDSSPAVTRTFVIGPGVFERYDGYVAAISTDSANLFDYDKGIMVRGSSYRKDLEAGKREDRSGNFYQEGEEWEKDCHVTLFSPEGEVLLEEDTKVKVSGYSSRGLPTRTLCIEEPTARQSRDDWFSLDIFKDGSYSRAGNLLTAAGSVPKGAEGDAVSPDRTAGSSEKKDSGQKKDGIENVTAISIPEDPVSFRRVRFRTHGIPNYHIRGVRNEYGKIISDESGFPGLSGARLGVVFLNGRFYTDCDVTPSVTAEYICDLFGLGTPDAVEKFDSSDYDVYTRAKIVKLFECDLTQEGNQKALEAAVDMDNYLFYFALEVLFNNADWPFNNVTMWRYVGEQDPENPYSDGRYRFLLDDLDQILSNDLHGNPEQWSSELIDYLMRDEKNTFCRVMQCPGYRDKFLTYIDDLLRTAFEPDHACAVLDALYNDLEREYILDYGQAFWAEMEDTAEKTKNNVREKESLYRANIAKYMGLEDRYEVRIEAGEGVSVSWNNMIVNPGGTWSNDYYRGTAFEAAAHPEQGYRFAGWEITGTASDGQNASAVTVQDGETLVISDSLAAEDTSEKAVSGTDAETGADAGREKKVTVTVRALAEPAP